MKVTIHSASSDLSMFAADVQLFTVSGSHLRLDSSVRFEAETHDQAHQQARNAGEQWVSEAPIKRKFSTVPVVQ